MTDRLRLTPADRLRLALHRRRLVTLTGYAWRTARGEVVDPTAAWGVSWSVGDPMLRWSGFAELTFDDARMAFARD